MWVEDGHVISKDFHGSRLDSSLTVCEGTEWLVCQDLEWHWLLCSCKPESSSFSSPVITTHHCQEISPLVQSRSESKLVCLFAMVSSSFSMVLLGFPSVLCSQWESFVWRKLRVSYCKYAWFMSDLFDSCLICLFRTHFVFVTVWIYSQYHKNY